MAQCIMSHAADYDVIHYHGHFPNIAKYIPLHINFVQTRHDQGADCVKHIRFRNGEICSQLDPVDCAACISSQPNALQRFISAFAVRSYRRDVAEAFQRHKTIFVSGMLRRNFTRVAGPGEWGVVLHNFVDLEKIQATLATASLTVDTDEKDLKIFIAGMLYPPKGIEALLQVFVPIIRANMQLIIAGSGPDEQRLRRCYESEQVTFLGWCDYPTVLSYAAASDIIIVPSICEEAFGATTLEGLLLGKPTFALERGGTPELKVYERYSGQLQLHMDIESLVTKLMHFHPEQIACDELDKLGGVDQAIHRILEIYQSPLSRT